MGLHRHPQPQRRATIVRCLLGGHFAPTYSNVEIIAVADCSTDSTAALLEVPIASPPVPMELEPDPRLCARQPVTSVA